MATILLIEDELHIAKGIILNLELKGHKVISCSDGISGIKAFHDNEVDLLILDLMLPGMSGEKILENVRAISEKFPVLVLSAKDESASKINCFNLGTDDYLSKPFNLEEFLLRVERLLKRSSWTPDAESDVLNEVYHFRDCWIDFKNFKASGVNGEIELTEQETRLLELFVKNRGEVLKRSEMLLHIGYAENSETRTLDNYIVRFRKYFEQNPKNPELFKSVRSVGYIFENEENE